MRMDTLAHQTERDKRQEQREDMPAQQQRHARLDQQLPNAAFLNEQDHPVERQHHSEKTGDFRRDHIVEIQAIE